MKPQQRQKLFQLKKDQQLSKIPTVTTMLAKHYSEVPSQDEPEISAAQGEEAMTLDSGNDHIIYSIAIAEDDQEEKIELTSRLDTLNSGNADDGPTTITVDEAIECLGTGRFQFIVLTAAGLCFAADAMQVLLLSFLSEVLRLEWNLSDDETAFITSMLFIGAIFGTLTLGPLADRKVKVHHRMGLLLESADRLTNS